MMHIFDPNTETCLKCGQARFQVEQRSNSDCRGTITYREYIVVASFKRTPIVKGAVRNG